MSTILIASALAHFLAGLALFTLAGMTGAALGRTAGRRALGWGLSATIALGLAEWCDLATGGSTRSACQWARLVLETIALVGLIELGRLCTTGPRAGLLPRWCYSLVAGVALVTLLLARLDALGFALRLAICWQAGWLATNYFCRDRQSATGQTDQTIRAVGARTLAARAIVGGLLIYLVTACVAIPLLSLVAIAAMGPSTLAARASISGPLACLLAACVAIPLPGMIAALISAAAAYLALGSNLEQNRQAKLRWRFAWPLGFVLAAAAGCFVLSAAGVFETESRLAEMAKADASDPQANQADADDATADGTDADRKQMIERMAAKADTPAVQQAKRIGLGLSPIIVFLLLIWGLSRLPFVH